MSKAFMLASVMVVAIFVSACAPIRVISPDPGPRPSPGPYVGARLDTASTSAARIAAVTPCIQASVDAPASDECRIDINVSMDANNQCKIVVTQNVQLANGHRRIRWVIKQANAAEPRIEFADFPDIPPILFPDSKGFAVPKNRLNENKFVAFPLKKHVAAYYYIFLQWSDGNKYQYCVADPIINNDDLPD